MDSLIEELDEFGHEVDKEHSARKDVSQESDLDGAEKDENNSKSVSKDSEDSKSENSGEDQTNLSNSTNKINGEE